MNQLRFLQAFLLTAGLLLSPTLRESSRPPARPGQAGMPAAGLTAPYPVPIESLGTAAATPDLTASNPTGSPSPGSDAGLPAPHRSPAAKSPNHSGADLDSLWRRWQRLIEQGAYQQMPIINAALADALRAGGGAEIYRQIGAWLRDAGLAFTLRAQLVELLGEIATPEALALLLELAGQGMESPMYAPALNSIGNLGANRWGGRFHEELSPLLEEAWRDANAADRPYLTAISRAIAGIGAPSGIALLLESLTRRDTAATPTDVTRVKKTVAFTETPKVTNPGAVPVLKGAVIKPEQPAFSITDASTTAAATTPAFTNATTVTSGAQEMVASAAGSAPASGVNLSKTVPQATSFNAQTAVLSVVVKGLENIGTEYALASLGAITATYPEAKAQLDTMGDGQATPSESPVTPPAP